MHDTPIHSQTYLFKPSIAFTQPPLDHLLHHKHVFAGGVEIEGALQLVSMIK
jgi:hypothetical protein